MKREFISTSPNPNGGGDYIYFRRNGRRVRLRERPGTAAFNGEYQRALEASERRILGRQPIARASTFGGLCQVYLTGPTFRAQKPRSQAYNRYNVARLQDRLGHQLHELLGEQDMRSLLRDHADTPPMANQLLKTVRMVWEAGIEAGLVSTKTLLPWAGVKLLKKSKPRRPVWDDGHVIKFGERFPPGTIQHRAMVLGYHCLQRRADLMVMGPHNYEGADIVIRQSKTDKRVLIPVSRVLGEALADATGRTFIVDAKGRPYRREDVFGRDFKTWCGQAGISGMSLHALRRGGATRLVNLGVGLPAIAALGGWTGLRQLEAYLDSRDTSALARAAVARIDQVTNVTNSAAKTVTGINDKTYIAHAFRDLLNGSNLIAGR